MILLYLVVNVAHIVDGMVLQSLSLGKTAYSLFFYDKS